MNNINILFWNCDGIQHKINELKTFSRINNIHIILLQETRLNQTTPLNLPNFFTYRQDRTKVPKKAPSGGTAILIKKNIIHNQETITTIIDSTSISIKLVTDIVQISSVYKSPKAPLSISDLNLLTNQDVQFIVAGDLNAKHPSWNSRVTNTAGAALHKHMESSNSYTITAPDSPTHHSYNPLHQPEVLDIALINIKNRDYIITNHNELSSDHNPVVLSISDSPIKTSPPIPRKRVNWKRFEEDLKINLPKPNFDLKNHSDIDKEITTLTTTIQSALEKNSYSIDRKQIKDPLTPGILLEITTKRILRKEWQRTRDPTTKKMLNAQIAHVRQLLNEHRQTEWDTFTSTLNFQDKSLYKLNRRLLRKTPASVPLKNNAGQKIYDTHQKAELFADTMENQFTVNQGDELPEVKKSIKQLDNINTRSTQYSTPKEIWQIIKKLPPAKAPGQDNIPNTALKRLPTSAIIFLNNIYTSSLRLSYFPNQWKTALIIMIPKPFKVHSTPNNYRPISLLTTLSKVFEKILLTHLQKYLKPREEQHAFRHGHSTTTQLVKLTDDLVTKFNNKNHTAAIFLDMEKAFDRVWHHGLIHKLHTMSNTPTHLVKIIQSFLSERKFQIKIDNHTSSTRNITAGVPQGSCLSPLLYSHYINDIPKEEHVTTSLFADDTMFYSAFPSQNTAIIRLQRQVDKAVKWMNTWKLKLNVMKTVTVLFGPKNKNPKRTVNISQQQIPWSNQARYLGVIFDKKLTFCEHANQTIKKAKRTRAMLYPVLNKSSPIPMQNRITIYKMYIKPTLLYAIPAWGPILKKHKWKQIEAVQNIALRTITGVHYVTRNETIQKSTNTNSLKEETIRAAKTFYFTNSRSTFQSIRQIGILPAEQKHITRPRPHTIVD